MAPSPSPLQLLPRSRQTSPYCALLSPKVVAVDDPSAVENAGPPAETPRNCANLLRSRKSTPYVNASNLALKSSQLSFQVSSQGDECAQKSTDQRQSPILSREESRRVVFSLPPPSSRYPFFVRQSLSNEPKPDTIVTSWSPRSYLPKEINTAKLAADSAVDRSQPYDLEEGSNIIVPDSTSEYSPTYIDNIISKTSKTHEILSISPGKVNGKCLRRTCESPPSLPGVPSSDSSVVIPSPQDNHLHRQCRLASTESDLQKILTNSVSIQSCSQSNSVGQLPLHVISENFYIADCENHEAVIHFIIKVWKTYPAAMMTADYRNHVPFENSIREWVALVETENKPVPNSETATFLSTTVSITQHVTSMWSSRNNHKRESDVAILSQVSPQANLAIESVSAILDCLESQVDCASTAMTQNGTTACCQTSSDSMAKNLEKLVVKDLHDELIRTFAGIPNFLATILRLEPGIHRQMLMESTLVRRMLGNHRSIGDWITDLLLYEPHLAMEYLNRVSDLYTSSAHVNKERRNIQSNTQSDDREEKLDALENEISRLPDFVPALLSLGDNSKIEEMATTKIVGKVLDRVISRPFALSMILLDAIFLTLLIAGFRGAVSRFLGHANTETILKWIYIANMGIFYALTRASATIVSLFMTTSANRLISVWNVIDFVATVLALLSLCRLRAQLDTGNTESLRSFLAVTTGFLWLRVLNFLKGINMQLATFVLAIIQITRDIFWFCVILLALVCSFAQMFFTLLVPESCTFDEDPDRQECHQSEYYLKVYAIFLGDFGLFEREHFTSILSVLLAIVYTFMVVLVLLNILIAVASDSYEKCLIRSRRLFGRARVMMMAELVCFQNLLTRHNLDDRKGIYKTWWLLPAGHGWSRASLVFFSLSIFVWLCWFLWEVFGYVGGSGNLFLSLTSISFNVCLFVGIMRFLDSDGDNSRCAHWIQTSILRLLGRSGDRVQGIDDAWQGRLAYLQSEMKTMTEQSWMQYFDRLNDLDMRMQHRLDLLREEVIAMRDTRFRG